MNFCKFIGRSYVPPNRICTWIRFGEFTQTFHNYRTNFWCDGKLDEFFELSTLTTSSPFSPLNDTCFGPVREDNDDVSSSCSISLNWKSVRSKILYMVVIRFTTLSHKFVKRIEKSQCPEEAVLWTNQYEPCPSSVANPTSILHTSIPCITPPAQQIH